MRPGRRSFLLQAVGHLGRRRRKAIEEGEREALSWANLGCDAALTNASRVVHSHHIRRTASACSGLNLRCSPACAHQRQHPEATPPAPPPTPPPHPPPPQKARAKKEKKRAGGGGGGAARGGGGGPEPGLGP